LGAGWEDSLGEGFAGGSAGLAPSVSAGGAGSGLSDLALSDLAGEPSPILAIGAPIWPARPLDQDLELAVIPRPRGRTRLVRLDLGEHIALVHVVAAGLLPLDDGALLPSCPRAWACYIRHYALTFLPTVLRTSRLMSSAVGMDAFSRGGCTASAPAPRPAAAPARRGSRSSAPGYPRPARP